MTKRPVTKLFAVIALATAAPAAANPTTTANDVKAPTAQHAPAPVTHAPTVAHAPMFAAILKAFGVTRPRQLPNGSPACGNVNSKVRPADCVPKGSKQ